MIPMVLFLSALSDSPVTLSAVRVEAESDRPVVRAVVSAPVPARVERDGRDLFLVLPGAHPAPGLELPVPVAEVQSLSVEETPAGARIRIRLESALPYTMTQEGGVVSVVIRAAAPAAPAPAPTASPRVSPDSVRDLYARIQPPPEAPAAAPPVPGADAVGATSAAPDDAEGLRFGLIRLRPWVGISYVDVQTAFLDTPAPVRDRYLEIDPHLGLSLGGRLPLPGHARFLLEYEPRFRLSTTFAELRSPTHLATGTLDVPVGAFVSVRGSHHFAKGLLETTEVDPGREYFFQLVPFRRNQTTVGLQVNPAGILGLEVEALRDSIHIQETGGFFSHRIDTVSSRLKYQFGASARAFLRYEYDHVPAPVERPVVESHSSTVSVGVNGDLAPLLKGDVAVGFTSLSAPRAGAGGTRFRGTTLSGSLRKELTPAASVTLLGRRDTYPSGFEQNAFYIATGAGLETDLGLPFSLTFHGAGGWQRNDYRVPSAGMSTPRQDELWSWSVGAGRGLTRWSFLRADYRYDRRNSNLPAFQTDGHLFMVQLGLGFLGATPTGTVPNR
jgi:hypothetical protein